MKAPKTPKTEPRNIALTAIDTGKRRDPGDLSTLTASIATVGLLEPVIVRRHGRRFELVDGNRRLLAYRIAAKARGWTTIPAVVLNADEHTTKIARLDANLEQLALSPLEHMESLEARKREYEALYPETRRGVAGGKARHGATAKMSFAVSEGKRTGKSSRTVERDIETISKIPKDVRDTIRTNRSFVKNRTQLTRLAKLPVETQRAVAKRVAAGMRGVNGALVHEVAETIKKHGSPTPTGKYDVIVIDPPWPLKGPLPYPTMTLDEIRALPVSDLAADNCMVLLWVANATMSHGFELLKAWGFEFLDILTWTKTEHCYRSDSPLLGMTEHVLIATKGKPLWVQGHGSTVLREDRPRIEARTRVHSRKPPEFYKLVEAAMPGRKLDMFSRQTREGWTTWGAEATKFDDAAE